MKGTCTHKSTPLNMPCAQAFKTSEQSVAMGDNSVDKGGNLGRPYEMTR